ncbi:unnamed protein product, partial [Prunus armeniaca]
GNIQMFLISVLGGVVIILRVWSTKMLTLVISITVFSLPSNSSGANYTFLEARLNGINVLVGRRGQSCDSVCKSKGQSCVPNKLLVLNQCDIMQKYMSCKGTCLASIGPDQPAEVVDDAPEDLYMTLNGALISLITFRILEHACLLKHNQCFLVMVHISIPGDCALVHSAVSGRGR